MMQRTSPMRQTMQTVHALLRGQVSPAAASAALGVPIERTEAYYRFVKNHMVDILEKTYTSFPSLLGSDWDRLVTGFYACHAPADYELNACARPFVDYLQQQFVAADPAVTPWLVELAQLEWLELEVTLQTDVETIAGSAMQRLQWRLNPTLQIARFSYPVVSFLLNWRQLQQPQLSVLEVDWARSDETALIFRHPDHLGYVTRVATPEDYFVIKLLHDQIDISDAARQANMTVPRVVELCRGAVDVGLAEAVSQT